jgi:hypothetical protein
MDVFAKGAKPFWNIPIYTLVRRMMCEAFFVKKGDSEFGEQWADFRSVLQECADESVGWVAKGRDGMETVVKLSAKGHSNYAFTNFLVHFCNKYKIIWVIFIGVIGYSPLFRTLFVNLWNLILGFQGT